MLEFPVAVAKALGSIAAILIGALIIFVAVRDETQFSTVKVTINPSSTDFLKAHRPGFGVPTEFIAQLNSMLSEATQYAQGSLTALPLADGVSLKPFGLDTTSSDITSLVRYFIGTRSPQLAIDVGCRLPNCEADRSGRKATQYFVSASIERGGRTQSISVPFEAKGTTFGNELRSALRAVAEQSLEFLEPTAASAYYVTQAHTAAFRERAIAYNKAAVRANLAAQSGETSSECFRRFWTSIELAQWGDRSSAAAILESMLKDSQVDGNTKCKTLARARLATHRVGDALCQTDDEQRAELLRSANRVIEEHRTDRSQSLLGNEVAGLMYARYLIQVNQVLGELAGPKSWRPAAICGFAYLPDAKKDKLKVDALLSVLDTANKALKQRGKQGIQYGFLLQQQVKESLEQFQERYAPAERAKFLKWWGTLNMENAAGSQVPADLYMAAGEAFRQLATLHFAEEGEVRLIVRSEGQTTQTTEGLSKFERRRFAQPYLLRAIASFRYAAAVSPKHGPAAELSLADTLYALNEWQLAKDTYVGIVRRFIEDEGPAEDYPFFVGAATRWAAIVTNTSECKGGRKLTDLEWNQVWSSIGVGDHNPCLLRGGRWSAEEYEKFGKLRRLVAFVGTLAKCQQDEDTVSRIFEKSDHIELAACIHDGGPETNLQKAMREGVITSRFVAELFD